MTEAALTREIEQARLSLFIPGDDALGDVHVMSFRAGILVDCRRIRPSFRDGLRWLMAHYDEEL